MGLNRFSRTQAVGIAAIIFQRLVYHPECPCYLRWLLRLSPALKHWLITKLGEGFFDQLTAAGYVVPWWDR